jgi:hypothetical protein
MVDKIIGSSFNFSFPSKAAPAGNDNFMDSLKEIFAKETGKLVGTNLPGLQNGVIYSPNPQTLLSLGLADKAEGA